MDEKTKQIFRDFGKLGYIAKVKKHGKEGANKLNRRARLIGMKKQKKLSPGK